MSAPILYVDNQEKLHEAVTSLSLCKQISIDLEFDKNYYRYGFTLCLIQIYSGDHCYLIDPVSPDIDINELFPVIENEEIQKVCFAFDEDLRLLHSMACYPTNLFDLSIASRLLNFPSTSLTNLLADQLNIDTGSSSQQSNWCKRPLDSNQLHYAANDVIHLFKLKAHFDKMANNNGVRNWIMQENEALQKLDYSDVDHNNYIKEKDKSDFNEFEWHIFKELLTWQNEKGEELNRPAYQIIPKTFLGDLARDSRNLMDWDNTRGVFRSLQTDEVKTQLLELIKKASKEAEQLNLSKKNGAGNSTSQEEYKKLMAQKSEVNRVKNSYFKPIKTHIEKKYGKEVANFLLSNRLILEMVTGTIDHMPEYRKELFLKCADELSLDMDSVRKFVEVNISNKQ